MEILHLLCMFAALVLCNGSMHLNELTAKNETHCHKQLRELADAQMLYVSCSTNHAVPVKLCIGCEEKYTDMVVAYDSLKENCTQMYFNRDRINVVETTQNMLKNLWDKAFCDDCFSSNNSQVFDDKSNKFTLCLGTNKGSECQKCISQYKNLNDFYTKIDEENDGKVCFDLKDAMNMTRVLWSKTLNCCQRQLHITGFIVAASCFGALPILFYIGAIILTKRREQNNLNMPPSSRETPARAPEPEQQVHPLIHGDPSASYIEPESNSDDEILPKLRNVT